MRSIKAALPLLLLGGCVSAGAYRAKADEAQRLRHDAIDHEKALLGRIGALEKQADDQARRLRAESEGRAQLAKQLDDTTALVGELRDRLLRLGQSAEELSASEGPLGERLREATARLQELRRQQAAAEASVRVYRGLLDRLRGPIDAGQLQVLVRDGRPLVALSTDALFTTEGALTAPGRAALAQVAGALRATPDRGFLVAGHVDDVPGPRGRYPSSWEQSVAQALEVTRALVQGGVRPQSLVAAGRGEFAPLYPNDGPEHRAQNRRVEIVLEPSPADLPPLEAFGPPQ